MEFSELLERRTRLRIDGRVIGAFAVFLAVLGVAILPLRSAAKADHRLELQESLAQRYRVTVIGAGILGIRGGQGTIRKPGGIAELRRDGVFGSLVLSGAATNSIHDGKLTVAGPQDFQFSAGEQFYIHSVYVGQDVVTLGLASTREITTPHGTGRLWAALNFFFPESLLANGDTNTVMSALDQWLLPEGMRPVTETAAAPPTPAPAAAPSSPSITAPPTQQSPALPSAAPAAVPAPAAPPAASSSPADLKPGMSRDDVVGLLGAPQREISYGTKSWLEYPGMVVAFDGGQLISVDRSGQPPAEVSLSSDPDGADIYLGDSFVGSAPAKLELPAGNYTFTMRLTGYKDWQRQVQILGGSQINLHAALTK
jgi:hypothetical protein